MSTSQPDPDGVSIEVGGMGVIDLAQSYEVKASVMTQPSAFSFQVGWGDVAAELLKAICPGMQFVLRVAGTQVQQGVIEGVDVPPGGPSVVRICGRDNLCKLTKAQITVEKSFQHPTYYELVRSVMDYLEIEDPLWAGNDANRRTIAQRIKTTPKHDEMVKQIETGVAPQGGGKVVFQALRAKIAQSWFDWLQEQLKLSGLFLWGGSDGEFILSRLNVDQAPLYRLFRKRGQVANTVNVLSHSARSHVENRFSKYIVHGRYGAGKGGRKRYKGEYQDPEMVEWGFKDSFVEIDDQIKSQRDADYMARRRCAEMRRASKSLSYTVKGHTVDSAFAEFDSAIWWPDTIVEVDDDELGIHGPKYIEGVTFRRGPETTTTLDLIDPEDLRFIAEKATG